MRLKHVVVLLCAVALIGCSGGSNNTSTEAAEDGISVLKEMADESDYSFFGYESEGDIGNEELGDPIEIKELDLNAFLASETATDAMIIDANEYLFPVKVGSTTIEAIRVMEEDGEWEYVSSESDGEIDTALSLVAASSLTLEDCFLLEIGGAGLYFVGYESGGQTMLTPLYTTTSPAFTSGTVYVFTEIAAEIKSAILTAIDEQSAWTIPSSNNVTLPINESVSVTKASGKTSKLLGVTLYAQEQDNWCWAASGRMTMLFAGGNASTITQCAQANAAFSQTTCCSNGGTAACNQPNLPEYDKWGFNYEDSTETPSWETLKALLNAGKPLLFTWMWTQGGGHGMVAVGFYENTSTSPATRMVNMIDPWPPNVGTKQSIEYNKWAGGASYGYTFGGYFTNVSKK